MFLLCPRLGPPAWRGLYIMKVKDKFRDYLNYLRQKGFNEKTIKEYRHYLLGAVSHAELLSEKELKKLKLTDTASIIESGKTHGVTGARRSMSVFRGYLRFLKESGIKIPFDYRDVKVPTYPHKKQIALEPNELRKIPTKNICDLRTRVLLEVCFATGLRVSEALSLNKADIDWKKKEAKVIAKGGDEEIVYFTDRSLRWIKRYLRTRKDDLSALFVNGWGTSRLAGSSARNYLLDYRKEWGFDSPITHHSCRRGLATYLAIHGADIKSTQHIMRHKSERTTLRHYIIVGEKRAKKVHRRVLKKI